MFWSGCLWKRPQTRLAAPVTTYKNVIPTLNRLTDDYNLAKQEDRSPPQTVDEKDAEEVAKPLDTHTEGRGFYLELVGFCNYCHLIRKITCGHPNDSEVEANVSPKYIIVMLNHCKRNDNLYDVKETSTWKKMLTVLKAILQDWNRLNLLPSPDTSGTCRMSLQKIFVFIIGPESDHWLCLSLTH